MECGILLVAGQLPKVSGGIATATGHVMHGITLTGHALISHDLNLDD
jgi:hypothetical protein